MAPILLEKGVIPGRKPVIHQSFNHLTNICGTFYCYYASVAVLALELPV